MNFSLGFCYQWCHTLSNKAMSAIAASMMMMMFCMLVD